MRLGPVLVLTTIVTQAQAPPAEPFTVVLRCEVVDDRNARVYELRRMGDGAEPHWLLAMRARNASPAVLMPLPGAKPSVTDGRATLEYETQNGGRAVRLNVTPTRATLDVHANFELEVNVEADLDRRVELMNTEGPISNLSCSINPER